MKIFIFTILVFSWTSVFAQTEIGVHYDNTGMPLLHFFDDILFSSSEKINKTYDNNNLETSYYYNNLNERVYTQISYDNNKMWPATTTSILYQKKYKPNEISRFVIGIDSFTTIDRYYWNGNLKDNRQYVKFVSQFDKFTFVEYNKVNYNLPNKVDKSFFIKIKEEPYWRNLNKKNYKDILLTYFGDKPVLKSLIESSEPKISEIESIIKMTQYFYKKINNEPIFLNKFLDETSVKKTPFYTCYVKEVLDSNWTLEYYHKNILLYNIEYSSLFPFKKHGLFKVFYPNGIVRKEVLFDENIEKETKLFDIEGNLTHHYEISEERNHSKEKVIRYHFVESDDGKNIIKDNEFVHHEVFDPFSGHNYTSIYHGKHLKSVFRVENSDTIFLWTNTKDSYNIKPLSIKFTYYMVKKKYPKAVEDLVNGHILVSFVINPKGFAEKSTILNTLHPSLDSLMVDFLETKISENSEYRLKFKPYKRNKKKRYLEVVIPFYFDLQRKNGRMNHNINYFNNNWIHHNMMNQMNSLPK